MARDKGLLSDPQLRHWIKVGTPLAKTDGSGLTSRFPQQAWRAEYFAIDTAAGAAS
jgi:hypothetical protein